MASLIYVADNREEAMDEVTQKILDTEREISEVIVKSNLHPMVIQLILSKINNQLTSFIQGGTSNDNPDVQS